MNFEIRLSTLKLNLSMLGFLFVERNGEWVQCGSVNCRMNEWAVLRPLLEQAGIKAGEPLDLTAGLPEGLPEKP